MLIALASTIVLLAAQAAAAPAPGAGAKLVDPSGKSAGTVTLRDAPGGVLLEIEAEGLTPGWHAIHLHQKGLCEGPAFTTAGAHFNPRGHKHGLLHPEGAEAGDLPNIFAEADGKARASLFTDLVSLTGAGERPALLDEDGASIVIHAGPDDHHTQPIGGSGDRVLCGVVKAK